MKTVKRQTIIPQNDLLRNDAHRCLSAGFDIVLPPLRIKKAPSRSAWCFLL